MLFCNFFVFLRFSLAEGGLFIGFEGFCNGLGMVLMSCGKRDGDEENDKRDFGRVGGG